MALRRSWAARGVQIITPVTAAATIARGTKAFIRSDLLAEREDFVV
jgi:hypothetical protein